MSDTPSSSSRNGIGFTTLLAVLFIGLKLGHVINWSWLWVLAPLWLPLAVVLAFCFIIFTVALIRDR